MLDGAQVVSTLKRDELGPKALCCLSVTRFREVPEDRRNDLTTPLEPSRDDACGEQVMLSWSLSNSLVATTAI